MKLSHFCFKSFLIYFIKDFLFRRKILTSDLFFQFFFYRIRNLLNIILRVSGTQIFSLSHAHDKLIISFFHKINYLGKFPKTVKWKFKIRNIILQNNLYKRLCTCLSNLTILYAHNLPT